MRKATNITWHSANVSTDDRIQLLKQKGCVLWLTGLSGSGKSTIAVALEAELIRLGHLAYTLDGDNIRHGLNSDLGFSADDRSENIRRISEVAALFADAGLITITAFISPYRADRSQARKIINNALGSSADASPRFIEVFINTPLEICEARDPKNLYKKARTGDIPNFTGISSPYEAPENPEITIDTIKSSVPEIVAEIVEYLHQHSVTTNQTS